MALVEPVWNIGCFRKWEEYHKNSVCRRMRSARKGCVVGRGKPPEFSSKLESCSVVKCCSFLSEGVHDGEVQLCESILPLLDEEHWRKCLKWLYN